MNWWISQFVLGFALTFWPAPLVGLWLLAEAGEPAPKQGLVPQAYGPLPEFNPGPNANPPEQPPWELELDPELVPVPDPHVAPRSNERDSRRPNLPAPQPRATDGRPPL